MRTFQRGNMKRIGLIGLVLTIFAVLLSMQYDRLPLLGTKIIYKAYLGESAGLQAGDAVNVAGVAVGKVESVSIEDSARVLVVFDVGDIPIGTDTRLAVKTATVLGSRAVEVYPAGERMQPGGEIAQEKTSTPYRLTDSLGELTTTISGLDTDSINQALETLTVTLDQTAPSLDSALSGVSRLSDSIASRDTELRSLFSTANDVSKVLGERSAQINSIVLDGNALLGALDARRSQVDALLENVAAVARQVSAVVAENREQITPALDQLNRALELLNRHRDDLDASILPLTQYAQSLGESVASGPFFKAYVGNLLPGQYLQPFIDAAFKDLVPVPEGPTPGPVYPLPPPPTRPDGLPAAPGILMPQTEGQP